MCFVVTVPSAVWRQRQVCGVLWSWRQLTINIRTYNDRQYVSRVRCNSGVLPRRLRVPWLSTSFRSLCTTFSLRTCHTHINCNGSLQVSSIFTWFYFRQHIDSVVATSNQRLYFLGQLAKQGLGIYALDSVFKAMSCQFTSVTWQKVTRTCWSECLKEPIEWASHFNFMIWMI